MNCERSDQILGEALPMDRLSGPAFVKDSAVPVRTTRHSPRTLKLFKSKAILVLTASAVTYMVTPHRVLAEPRPGAKIAVESGTPTTKMLQTLLLNGLTDPKAAQQAQNLNRGRQSKIAFRGRYHKFGGTLTRRAINALVKNDLFVAGPHGGAEFNLNARDDFGRYNPLAIEEIMVHAEILLTNESFVDATHEVYRDEFQTFLRICYDAYFYHEFYAPVMKPIAQEYRAAVAKGRTINFRTAGGPHEAGISPIYSFADALTEGKKYGPAWIERVTAMKFWMRRGIDGSAPQLFAGLHQVMKTYDPDFIAAKSPNGPLDIKHTIASKNNELTVTVQ